jgi:hypothetical protein
MVKEATGVLDEVKTQQERYHALGCLNQFHFVDDGFNVSLAKL